MQCVGVCASEWNPVQDVAQCFCKLLEVFVCRQSSAADDAVHLNLEAAFWTSSGF